MRPDQNFELPARCDLSSDIYCTRNLPAFIMVFGRQRYRCLAPFALARLFDGPVLDRAMRNPLACQRVLLDFYI